MTTESDRDTIMGHVELVRDALDCLCFPDDPPEADDCGENFADVLAAWSYVSGWANGQGSTVRELLDELSIHYADVESCPHCTPPAPPPGRQLFINGLRRMLPERRHQLLEDVALILWPAGVSDDTPWDADTFDAIAGAFVHAHAHPDEFAPKTCVKCRSVIDEPVLTSSEPERCERCAE